MVQGLKCLAFLRLERASSRKTNLFFSHVHLAKPLGLSRINSFKHPILKRQMNEKMKQRNSCPRLWNRIQSLFKLFLSQVGSAIASPTQKRKNKKRKGKEFLVDFYLSNITLCGIRISYNVSTEKWEYVGLSCEG